MKIITQICTILGTISMTFFVLSSFGLTNNWYYLLILAGVPAVLSPITIAAINRWEDTRKWWKVAYAIPIAGVTLLFLILSEPTLPYRSIGFIILILLVGIPADIVVNRKSTGFFSSLKPNVWDIITDIAISCISGYIIAINWSNSITVIATLLIADAIMILWNFSIRSKGPRSNKKQKKQEQESETI